MKCPRCVEITMQLAKWKPDEGLESRLRKFVCPKCSHVEYKIPQGWERKQDPVENLT